MTTGTCSEVSGRWSGKYELIVVINEDVMKNSFVRARRRRRACHANVPPEGLLGRWTSANAEENAWRREGERENASWENAGEREVKRAGIKWSQEGESRDIRDHKGEHVMRGRV